MTKEYATPEECAAVTRQATTDENWLANQLDRIDPHRHEIGSAGDRPALERLVFELKADVERLRKDAERLDYIEESGNFGVTRYRSGPGGPVLIEAEDGKKDISKSASSLRDAIDSVIKDAKGTP